MWTHRGGAICHSRKDFLTTEGAKDTKIGILKKCFLPSCFSCAPLKIRGGGASISLKQNPSIASFQHGVLESRLTWMFPDASLQTWMPAIHAGMTKICIFCSVGERKIMNHFVVISMFLLIAALRTPGLCGEDFFTLNPEEPQFEYVSIICPRQD